MWNYMWGMTIAQIQLLTSDCPIIVYDNKEDKKEKKPKKVDISKAKDAWEAKYKDKTNAVNLNLKDFK